MIQIIKENRPESTSDKFANAFSRLGRHAEQQLGEHLQGKRLESERQKKIQLVSQLSGRDASGLDDKTLDSLLQHGQNMEKQKSEYGFKGDLERQKHDLENLNKKEEINKENEEIDPKITAQKSFNGMAKILKDNRIGRGSSIKGYFGGQTAKDAGKFVSLSGGLEALLVDMVSRGTLSNTRFEYITQTLLPKPTDSINEIKGKMEGLAEILNLDPTELGIEPNQSSNQTKQKQSLQEIFG